MPTASPNHAEILALQALAAAMADQRLAERFLSLSGLTIPDLRQRAGDREILVALLRFLEANEPDLLAVAGETGLSAPQVALAWLRDRAARSTTAFVPVIGPRGVDQLEEYLTSLDVTLTEEHLARLDTASAVELGSPHEIGRLVRDSLIGGDPDRMAAPAVPVA